MNSRRNAIAAEKEPGLDLSSLIDVSFLLLIYFLVTMTLQVPDADLTLTMPGPPDGKTKFEMISEPPVIEIAADGQIFYSDEAVESAGTTHHLPVLKDRLSDYLKVWSLAPTDERPEVFVKADDSARGQRFIDVLNCLAEVGISNVAVARDEWSN